MYLRVLLVVLSGATAGSKASAATDRGRSEPELLPAVLAAPTLQAVARRTEAARARIDASGRFPDPEVEGMISRMDGPMGGRATMFELNLRQPLPRRGERMADRERAAAGVSMAEADFALMAGDLAAGVAMALADAAAADARAALLETQRARLQAVSSSLETRLAAGTSVRLADRLALDTRLAAMTLEMERERRMAEDARAEVRGRLGLASDAALPAFAAPSAREIDPSAAAVSRVASARAREADAMVQMAKASARPMTAVGLRLERERTGMGDEDIVGVAFMSEIPWRSRRYAAAEVLAAGSDREAALAEGDAARFRIHTIVTRVARAERLAETARRLAEETRRRLEAEYDALVRTAAAGNSGDSTVFQLVELLEQATDTELQVVDAEFTASAARAELWRHLPAERFLTTYSPSSP